VNGVTDQLDGLLVHSKITFPLPFVDRIRTVTDWETPGVNVEGDAEVISAANTACEASTPFANVKMEKNVVKHIVNAFILPPVRHYMNVLIGDTKILLVSTSSRCAFGPAYLQPIHQKFVQDYCLDKWLRL